MAYTSISAIREKTGYTSSQISDSEITNCIAEATSVINSEINTHVIRERVRYIDNTRQNKIDGSNKTFYVNKSITNNFGDSNDDGALTVADIKVEIEDSDDNITEATVASIDVEGSYTLSSAPSESTTEAMYVTYSYTYYDITIPDKMVYLLATYLASSYSAAIVEEGLSSETKFGNITIRNAMKNTSYAKFTTRYDDLLRRASIPLNKPRTKTYNYQI